MNLTFDISASNDVSIVSFKGRITSEKDLDSIADEMSQQKNKILPNLIFDLNELTHINSSGINYIIRSLTRARINNGDLVLASVKGNVKTLFEIAKINEIFSIYDNKSDAINHFKK